MEKAEAKSAVKAIYLQSAALAGLEVSPFSPERFADIVEQGFTKVVPSRKPTAIANALRLIAETLVIAEEQQLTMLQESTVDQGKQRICPVYPFGG